MQREGARVLGAHRQGLLVAGDRLREVFALPRALREEQLALRDEIIARPLRLQAVGGLEVALRVLEASLLQAQVAEPTLPELAPRLERQVVLEERLGAPPVTNLEVADDRERDDRRGARQREPRAAPPARCQELGHAPCDRDREPDERQVHEAVRAGLLARLHHADHRNQHAEEPEPADGEPRAGGPQREAGRECEQRRGARAAPARDRPRAGVGSRP